MRVRGLAHGLGTQIALVVTGVIRGAAGPGRALSSRSSRHGVARRVHEVQHWSAKTSSCRHSGSFIGIRGAVQSWRGRPARERVRSAVVPVIRGSIRHRRPMSCCWVSRATSKPNWNSHTGLRAVSRTLAGSSSRSELTCHWLGNCSTRSMPTFSAFRPTRAHCGRVFAASKRFRLGCRCRCDPRAICSRSVSRGGLRTSSSPRCCRHSTPQLGDTPLLILGEDGSGRGLLARYVHGFGQGDASQFVHVVCTRSMTGGSLRDAIHDAAGDIDASLRCTIWLDETDALSIPTQRQLARWIEFGLPASVLRCRVARWIATACDAFEPGASLAIQPALRDALSGLSIRIPSVRERRHLIAPFANNTALAWCAARRQHPRRFGEDAIAVLEEYPWAGNLRELEAVVAQTLAAGAGDPIRADELQYDGTAFAPINPNEADFQIDSREMKEFDEFDPTSQPTPTAAAAAMTPRELIPRPEAPPEDQALQTQPETENAADAPDPELAVGGIQRLVGAIAHEIRNPLSTIRTFAALLPTRYDDADFRETFTELVGQDAHRLEAVVAGLAGLASLAEPNPVRVDIAALIEELLEQRRPRVHARKLLILKELAANDPPALVDEGQIRIALDSILDKTIELSPERGDVYVGAQHHPVGLRSGPAIRILIRFGSRAGRAESGSAAPRVAGVSAAENSLSFAIAEAIVRRQAGAFAIDFAKGYETVMLIDIPASLD